MTRDFSKPYTAEELEGLKEVFRKQPTFKDEGYISSSDIANICKSIGYDRSPEQIEIFKSHYDKYYGGIVTLSRFIDGCGTMHDTAEAAVFAASAYDRDGDGNISKDEFEEFLEMMTVHDPRLAGTEFKSFVKEADSDGDGKVSVEEFAKWIRNNLSP